MQITFLGHAAFKVVLQKSVLLFDPFLTGNPLFEKSGLSVDDVAADVTHILLTHGHEDHVGDTVALAQKTNATVVCMVELASLLQQEGVETLSMHNLGGTFVAEDFSCTFVRADHSSSWQGQYAGLAAGIVLQPEEGPTLYHMGDTDLFSDMGQIHARYTPDIGLVPMGGHFTMDAPTAAYACNTYFKFKKVVPVHYETFPVLAQNAEAFVADITGTDVCVLSAGESLQA